MPVSGATSAAPKIEDVGTPTEDEKKMTGREGVPGEENVEGDNLSEFSDDGDEILDKNDEEQLRLQQGPSEVPGADDNARDGATVTDDAEERNVERRGGGNAGDDLTNQDDLTLDFEEISDGELEEESAKVKGLGDALGVDWAGLVAEQRVEEKRPATDSTVKEMWQPRRIFRDVGISVRMAGAELAQRLLGEDPQRVRIKAEPLDEDAPHMEARAGVGAPSADAVNVLDNPVASCQVALRKRNQLRAALIVNKSGNQVALCARRDLQIRRQLCGLPAWEIQMGGRSRGAGLGAELQQQQEELRSLAIEMFAKATAVH